MLTKIVHGIECMSWACAVIAGFTLAGMFVVVTQDVIRRQVVTQSALYGVDVPTMLLPGVAYLAVAYVAARGGHVRIDLLVIRLSLRTQAILGIFGNLLFLLFASIIVWQGGENMVTLYTSGSYYTGVERLLRWPFAVSIPVGGFFLCVQIMVLLGRNIVEMRQFRKV